MCHTAFLAFRENEKTRKTPDQATKKLDDSTRCSFCDRPHHKVEWIIQNPEGSPAKALICSDCVERCNVVLKEQEKTDGIRQVTLYNTQL